tara:strand:+ start:1637 stop:4450 length:2814 start_codon:yes stop_codon:yes gene_type:complete
MASNLNSGQNIISATTAAPSIGTAYEKTPASNETGVFIWANKSVEVHGYASGVWSQLQSLGTDNRFLSVSWDDYTYVYVRGVSQTESVRIFLRVASGVAGKVVAASRLDKISAIPDVSTYTLTDSGKLATISATGVIDFEAPPSAGTPFGDNVYPNIDSIDTEIVDMSQGATRIAINGTGFFPASKIYVFAGVPTALQTTNLTGFDIAMLDSVAADADVIMDQANTETVFVSEKIVVGWSETNNEFGGVASFGFVNPKKMVISLSPLSSQVGAAFSILVVNPNGKKALYQNCFAVETVEVLSVSPALIDENIPSSLQIVGKHFDINTNVYVYDGTETAGDRAALINYKSNAFTFQDAQNFVTTNNLTFDILGSDYTVIAAKGGSVSTLVNAFSVAPPAFFTSWTNPTAYTSDQLTGLLTRTLGTSVNGDEFLEREYSNSTYDVTDGVRIEYGSDQVHHSMAYGNNGHATRNTWTFGFTVNTLQAELISAANPPAWADAAEPPTLSLNRWSTFAVATRWSEGSTTWNDPAGASAGALGNGNQFPGLGWGTHASHTGGTGERNRGANGAAGATVYYYDITVDPSDATKRIVTWGWISAVGVDVVGYTFPTKIDIPTHGNLIRLYAGMRNPTLSIKNTSALTFPELLSINSVTVDGTNTTSYAATAIKLYVNVGEKSATSNVETYVYGPTAAPSDIANLTNPLIGPAAFTNTGEYMVLINAQSFTELGDYTVIVKNSAKQVTATAAFNIIPTVPWYYADTTIFTGINMADHRVSATTTALVDIPISTANNPDGFRLMLTWGDVYKQYRQGTIGFTYADDATQTWSVRRQNASGTNTLFTAFYTGGSGAVDGTLLNAAGLYSWRYSTFPAALAIATDGTVTLERIDEDAYGANQTFTTIYTFPTLVDVTNASNKSLRMFTDILVSSVHNIRLTDWAYQSPV